MKETDVLESKLGKRIVFLILLAGVLPLLVFIIPLYFQSYNFLHEEALESMETYTKFATGQIFLTLEQATDRLRFHSRSNRVPSAEKLTLFSRIKRVETIEQLAPFLPSSENFREQLQSLRDSGEQSVLMSHPYSVKQETTVALIITDSAGRFWIGELDPAKLWQPLRGSLYGSGDLVMVVDKDSRFLSASREIPFQPLEQIDKEFSATFPRGEQGQGEAHLKGFGEVLWVSKNLWLEGAFGSGDWYLLILRKSGEIGTLSRRLMQSLGIWLGLALSGLILLSFRFARKLYNPICDISDATNRIAQGNWSMDLSIDRDDELGQLGENFVQMKETIRGINQKLEYDATHDSLTGLPNRTLVEDRLQQNINRARRHAEYSFAVIYFDLDGFKQINDTHGHARGDDLLQRVSKRIKDRLRATDIFGRIGGDEFIMVLDSIDKLSQVTKIAEEIKELMDKPFTFNNHEINLGISMGIVQYNRRYDHAQELLEDADSAMYRAKQNHDTKSYAVYGQLIDENKQPRLDMETSLEKAIERDQFELFFQPVMNLTSGDLIGAETSLRWKLPDRGWILPGQFLPVADEIGFCDEITGWMIENTAEMLIKIKKANTNTIPWLSLNLSSAQFKDGRTVKHIRKILETKQLPLGYFKVGVKEALLHANPVERLKQLREEGVEVILDDYDLGHSSLYRLKELPIDWLKIEREFIRDLHNHPDHETVLASTIGLTSKFNIKTIAQGITHENELRAVRDLGCEYGQGDYYDSPLPTNDFYEKYFEPT